MDSESGNTAHSPRWPGIIFPDPATEVTYDPVKHVSQTERRATEVQVIVRYAFATPDKATCATSTNNSTLAPALVAVKHTTGLAPQSAESGGNNAPVTPFRTIAVDGALICYFLQKGQVRVMSRSLQLKELLKDHQVKGGLDLDLAKHSFPVQQHPSEEDPIESTGTFRTPPLTTASIVSSTNNSTASVAVPVPVLNTKKKDPKASEIHLLVTVGAEGACIIWLLEVSNSEYAEFQNSNNNEKQGNSSTATLRLAHKIIFHHHNHKKSKFYSRVTIAQAYTNGLRFALVDLFSGSIRIISTSKPLSQNTQSTDFDDFAVKVCDKTSALVTCATFVDEKIIALAMSSGKVALYNIESRSLVMEFLADPARPVVALEALEDYALLTTTKNSRELRIWDIGDITSMAGDSKVMARQTQVIHYASQDSKLILTVDERRQFIVLGDVVRGTVYVLHFDSWKKQVAALTEFDLVNGVLAFSVTREQKQIVKPAGPNGRPILSILDEIGVWCVQHNACIMFHNDKDLFISPSSNSSSSSLRSQLPTTKTSAISIISAETQAPVINVADSKLLQQNTAPQSEGATVESPPLKMSPNPVDDKNTSEMKEKPQQKKNKQLIRDRDRDRDHDRDKYSQKKILKPKHDFEGIKILKREAPPKPTQEADASQVSSTPENTSSAVTADAKSDIIVSEHSGGSDVTIKKPEIVSADSDTINQVIESVLKEMSEKLQTELEMERIEDAKNEQAMLDVKAQATKFKIEKSINKSIGLFIKKYKNDILPKNLRVSIEKAVASMLTPEFISTEVESAFQEALADAQIETSVSAEKKLEVNDGDGAIEKIIADTLNGSKIEKQFEAATKEMSSQINESLLKTLQEHSSNLLKPSLDALSSTVKDSLSSVQKIDQLVDDILEQFSAVAFQEPEISVAEKIEKALAEQDFESAFRVALEAGDQELLERLCSKISPDELFSYENILSQKTTLLLMDGISKNLFEGSIMWLHEASMSLEPEDEVVAPEVLTQINARLDRYYASLQEQEDPKAGNLKAVKVVQRIIKSLII